MQRYSLVLIPAIVAIALFFSLDLFNEVTDTRVAEIGEAPDRNIEAYGEGINTILFDEQGRIDYTLQSSRQVVYQDQVSELDQPFIRLYREGESRWNIVAESGRISTASGDESAIEEINLLGGVQVYMLDDYGNRTVLDTDFLDVNPRQETLNTTAPVQMTSAGVEQSSIGMQASLADQTIKFMSDIRGVYVVPTKP